MKVQTQKEMVRATKGTLPIGTIMDLDAFNAKRLESLGVVKIIGEEQDVASKPRRSKKAS